MYAAVNPSFAAVLRSYDLMAVQIEPVGKLGYRQRPNAVFHYANGTTATANALGFRGPMVATARRPGTIRIVLLGGSTTHGFGVPDGQTIDAYMRELLSKRHPESQFDVINLAFDGYDSYQILERFQADGLPFHPDIVFFNEGINDVRNAWFPHLRDADPRTLIWEPVLQQLRSERTRGGPTSWTLIKHYLLTARMGGYIRDQVRRRAEARARSPLQHAPQTGAAVRGERSADLGDQRPPYAGAARLFDRHIRQLTAVALANGARVVLSTPPSALRSYPPTATSSRSYWVIDAQTTQEYRDVLAQDLRSIAADEAHEHRPVRYLAPMVPSADFIDDCHLTGKGNELVAETFADAVDSILVAQNPRR